MGSRRSPDSDLALLAVRWLATALHFEPTTAQLVEAADGIEALDRHQFSDVDDLRVLSCQLVDQYWGADYGACPPRPLGSRRLRAHDGAPDGLRGRSSRWDATESAISAVMVYMVE